MEKINELILKKNQILMKIAEQQRDLEQIEREMAFEQKRELHEQIEELTDTLNSLFQHPILEKAYPSLCNALYDAMNELDKVACEMSEELETLNN